MQRSENRVPSSSGSSATSIRTAHPEQMQAQSAPEHRSPWKLGGLSTVELAKRVWAEMQHDQVIDRSAQLAYYFFLALFPGLIFLTTILAFIAGPGSKLNANLLQYISTAIPGSAFELVRHTLQETTRAAGAGKLTFGLLAALWTATSGMSALQSTLNAVYNVEEGRPFWKAKLIAIGLTIACSVLAIIALGVFLYGNDIAEFAARNLHLGAPVLWTWKIAQWPIALFFLSLVFATTYYFAPDVEQRRWQWITPGAVVGMVTWILASVALKVYLHFFNSYSATYGSLGAVIILLTWFYVTGMMLLIGAEVNAEIENASAEKGEPGTKLKGEKVPASDREKRPAA